MSWSWTLKPFSPQIKKDFESSYGLKMKLIFPTPDPFLGEAKGSGLTSLVGQVRFRFAALGPLTNFIVVLVTEV